MQIDLKMNQEFGNQSKMSSSNFSVSSGITFNGSSSRVSLTRKKYITKMESLKKIPDQAHEETDSSSHDGED